MVFVTNKRYNQEATEYLQMLGDEIDAWDLDRLYDQYTYAGKDKPVEDKFTFTIDPKNIISYQTSNDIKVTIAPVKATELIKLKGIQDRTLFARNVRYGLGRTRVNKEITKTLSKQAEHENFFLYHNGITLVCSKLDQKENKLVIKNYSIVNGCQSTLSFYESKNLLSDNINILLRVIQTGDQDRLSQNITYYTNNQNAISLKDLKSNDKVQQDLQIEFHKLFSNEILYKIKSGEDERDYLRVIENDFAAQLITAFYLKEPYTAHQKAEIFASNYIKVFNRHIDASFIFLLAEIYRAIDEKNDLIEDEGIRTYKLTRFFFVYIFRLIFDDDPAGKELLENPSVFLEKYLNKYFEAFSKLFQLLVLDFNYNIKSEKDNNQGYFDYKNSLRNAEKTREMSNEVVKAYKRHLVHHKEDSFSSLIS